MSGFVSLVGAGPGSPDLLSLRAVDRLQRADLVLYDALVDPAVLEHAEGAQRFYVGKRAGRHSVRQETINALLVRHASRGRRVVRLKCGDPFVLGRGGEEALALRKASIPFEVVPGITSAISAPAMVGVPVTHRGQASGFVVLTGHSADGGDAVLSSLPPNSTTVVILMGFARRAAIAARLVDAGWSAETSCALVESATTAHQRSWFGALRELAAAPFADAEGPVTLVVGPTVGLGVDLGFAPATPPSLESLGAHP